MSYEKPGCPPQSGFFLRLWQPRLSYWKIYPNLGTVAQSSRFRDERVGVLPELAGDTHMLSSSGHPERGNWKLPSSSWALPAITIFLVLLAVAAALA